MPDTAEPFQAVGEQDEVLRISVTPQAAAAELRLSGDLDQSSVAILRGAVDGELADGRLEVVIDVADLSFVDAAGFRELRAAQDRARAHGGRVVVVGYDAFFAELAKICDAEDVLGPA